MKTILTINIDLDKKCTRCKKAGATQSGLCMRCIAQGIIKGEYDIFSNGQKNILPMRRDFK